MKKTLAMLLVVIMVIGMFAGCVQTQTDPTTTAKPNNDTPGTTTTLEQIPEELTLKIMVSNELQGNLDFHDRENWNVWPAFEAMCEKYNLNIEFQIIEKDQYATQLTMALAGDASEMPDAVWLGGEDIMSTAMRVEAIQEGLFYAIDDVMKYSDGTFKNWYDTHLAYPARTAYADGKLYWIGEYGAPFYNGAPAELGKGSPTNLNVRLDWLDALGYTDVPNTLDEFEAYVLACQEADLNGNGVKDETFLCGLTDINACGINKYLGIPSSQFGINLQTGEVVNPWYHKNAQKMIAIIIDWLDKGIIEEDRIGKSSGTTAYRNGNKVALYHSYFCDNWSLTNCEVPEGASQAILIGALPDTTVHPDAFMGYDSAPTMDNRSFAFTKNLSHPAAAAALLDIISSAEYENLITWGTEGESYEIQNGKKVYINGAEDYGKAAETNIMVGNAVFTFGIFPKIGTSEGIDVVTEDAASCTGHDTTGRMQAACASAYEDYDVVFPNQPNSYYAIPTPEENETLSALESDYLQLSGEIFVSFLTGERDLILDWDDAIAELEAAGLKELLKVYQDRTDRFFAGYNAG